MPDKKEKSAVGIGVPATEIKKPSNESIYESEEKIKCVLQHPAEISKIIKIKNTVGTMNSIVGGRSTVVTTEIGLNLVMNIYGDRRGTPNLKTLWGKIYGTVLITAMKGKEYVSLTPEQIHSARAWLLRNTYHQEETT